MADDIKVGGVALELKIDDKRLYSDTKRAADDARKQFSQGLSADEQRAINRHRQAQEERMAYMQNGSLKQDGKDDLYTLTQPRFAFWAASGYNTFHLRNCKKMSGLKNLKGFSLYADATAAGYRPCKCCKPTSKHDIYLSLPIYSKKRYGDGIRRVIRLWRLR